MIKQNVVGKNYNNFLKEIIGAIKHSRVKTYQIINKQLVDIYLFIGRSIYEKIEAAGWGQGIIEKLSDDLQQAFPEMRGFSVQNLWRMKQLYESYYDNIKLSTLSRVLPWSHNVLILHKTDSIEEKEFYLKTCINERWGYRELERQIESGTFFRV